MNNIWLYTNFLRNLLHFIFVIINYILLISLILFCYFTFSTISSNRTVIWIWSSSIDIFSFLQLIIIFPRFHFSRNSKKGIFGRIFSSVWSSLVPWLWLSDLSERLAVLHLVLIILLYISGCSFQNFVCLCLFFF